MSTLNVSEKIASAAPQIYNLFERYKNSDTAALKKQDMTQIFESITAVIDGHQANKDQVKHFLFSYLRFLNKVLCTNADVFKVHIELENQVSYLRSFIIDEISNIEKNSLGTANT